MLLFWSTDFGNHLLQVLTLGPLYIVGQGDDLGHIADRFGVPLTDLLLWNPDIGASAAQKPRQVQMIALLQIQYW